MTVFNAVKLIQRVGRIAVTRGKALDQVGHFRKGVLINMAAGQTGALRLDQQAKQIIESLCRIPVEVEYASEFRYRNPVINKDDMFRGAMQTVYGGTAIKTSDAMLDELVATRGMEGMLSTVWLILCAMCFGATMTAGGMTAGITRLFTRFARGRISTVSSTIATGLMLNTTVADQYMGILLSGNVFREIYDKNGELVYLYATNKDDQYSYIKSAQDKGYSVLLLDGQLDVPMVSMLENKFEKSHFARVDADIIDRLIVKDDKKESAITGDDRDNLSEVFRSQMPQMDKAQFNVDVESLGENAQPVVITESEYMRRMKEMSHFQPGMSFYGQMPDTYTIVLNADHKLVKEVLDDTNKTTAEALKPVVSELKGLSARLAALHQSQNGKKPEDLTQEEKDDVQNTQKAISEQHTKKNQILGDYAKGNNIVHQLIDLALLQNGMLKGEALDKFLKRSVDMIK